MRRLATAGLSGIALTGSILVTAPTANAAAEVACAGTADTATYDFTLSPGETREITLQGENPNACYNATGENYGDNGGIDTTTMESMTLFQFGSTAALTLCTPSTPEPCGTSTQGRLGKLILTAGDAESPMATQYVLAKAVNPTYWGELTKIRVEVVGSGPAPGPGNGGTSVGQSGSSAPMLDLTLNPTETDATCSVAEVSGPRGSWVTLEAASDCTPPPSTPDATLLGWATDPDFPVDIAQRQVDNGWGAYETYNDDGQLTGVFIPAGGAASLTNSNTLHAIWSDTTTGN